MQSFPYTETDNVKHHKVGYLDLNQDEKWELALTYTMADGVASQRTLASHQTLADGVPTLLGKSALVTGGAELVTAEEKFGFEFLIDEVWEAGPGVVVEISQWYEELTVGGDDCWK